MSWNIPQPRNNVFLVLSFNRLKGTIIAAEGNGDDQDDNNEGEGNNSRDIQSQQESQEAAPGGLFQPVDSTVSAKKWKARFTPPNPLPAFVWKPSISTTSKECARLLIKDLFIDKSAALFHLLKDYFEDGDFLSVAIYLVYPRHFGKTTVLGFIEAVFSPVQKLGTFDLEHDVKTKIASLKRGKDLLEFGLHPVLRLELELTSSVEELNNPIAYKLQVAGLDKVTIRENITPLTTPRDRVNAGVILLNEKFREDTGLQTNTIVLIDEHDKPFCDRNKDMNDPFIRSLMDLFSLGKGEFIGISLMIFCGRTRILVGSDFSTMTNLVDVSQKTIYHGLCGISARELLRCANGQLDFLGKGQYYGTLENVLKEKFGPDWGGFRFGFDRKHGELDPKSSEGALFSPLDVWEIVRSLLGGIKTPTSRWIQLMELEFDFLGFSDKYISSNEGHFALLKNLERGWVNTADPDFKMTREDYMLLSTDLHVQKVLLELGLLSVKDVDDENDKVLLGPPNSMVKRISQNLLVKVTKTSDVLMGNGGEFHMYFKLPASFKTRNMMLPDNPFLHLVLDGERLQYRFETFPEANPVPDDIAEGDIVRVSRYESTRAWEAPLFIRRHWVDQLEKVKTFLDDDSLLNSCTRKWKLYVTGAPGCGKTCFFWMYAFRLMQQGKRVLFIQYRKKKQAQIWILEDFVRKCLTSPKVESDNIVKVVKALLNARTQENKFDVCICDGVHDIDLVCDVLLSVLDSQTQLGPGTSGESKISKLVLVTSLQFQVSSGTEAKGRSLGIAAKMPFDSWRKEDYESAARSDFVNDFSIRDVLLRDAETWNIDFRELDTTQQMLEVVRQKFEYAGGSAHYMFDVGVDELQKDLDELCGRVADWKTFCKPNLAGKASEAVNLLMQQFVVEQQPSLYAPVSKYVMLRAYDACRAELTAAIKAVAEASDNGALLGYAFELSQKDAIRSALNANLSALTAKLAPTSVRNAVKNSKLYFCPRAVATFNGKTFDSNVESGSVIWCSKLNQGLFDCAFYFDKTLVALQFTVGKPHDLKLQFMRPLINAIKARHEVVEVKQIYLLVIIPKENAKEFGFQKVTGLSEMAYAMKVVVDTAVQLEWLVGEEEINTVETGKAAITYYVK